MIRRGSIECDGCGVRTSYDDSGPLSRSREYVEGRAEEAGWLVERMLGAVRRPTPGRHYCRTCRHAVERDSLVPTAPAVPAAAAS